jgi:septin family protein
MRTHRYRILRHYPEANITVTYGAFDCQNISAAWKAVSQFIFNRFDEWIIEENKLKPGTQGQTLVERIYKSRR